MDDWERGILALLNSTHNSDCNLLQAEPVCALIPHFGLMGRNVYPPGIVFRPSHISEGFSDPSHGCKVNYSPLCTTSILQVFPHLHLPICISGSPAGSSPLHTT